MEAKEWLSRGGAGIDIMDPKMPLVDVDVIWWERIIGQTVEA
jgi:hypothetical protein